MNRYTARFAEKRFGIPFIHDHAKCFRPLWKTGVRLPKIGGMSSPSDPRTEPVDTIPFDTVAIVGVGLIGGSLAAAIKRRQVARKVIGIGRDAARIAEAERLGLIDEATTSIEQGASLADLIVFCTPVDRIVAGVRQAAAACRPGTLITDAGSVKGAICVELSAGLPAGVEFVGSHPLAGSEKQGFEHADAELFERRVCVVTPVASSSRLAVERVAGFWKGLGSTVIEMTPSAHDHAVAQISHLPHVVAAALAGALEPENARLAASGFRDTTRIASGDPELWTAILMANAKSVLGSLRRYDESIAAFRHAIEEGNAERLKQLLATARSRRNSACDANRGFSEETD